jgi:tetratricopeptide (TPR) repeat protein
MFKKEILFSSLLLGFVCCFVTQPGIVSARDQNAASEKIRLLNVEIIAANERRDLPAALQASEEAVRVAQAEFGEDSLQAADTLSNLASLYLHIKRVPEAAEIYEKVVGIYLAGGDKESPEIAAAYFSLGAACAMQQKYQEALKRLHQSLAIRMKSLGPDASETKNVEQMIAQLTPLVSRE